MPRDAKTPPALPALTPLRAAGILATLLFGAVGGILFFKLTMPLPWMIGAMVVTTVAALAGAPLKGPGGIRPLMITILGIMLGSAFTSDALAHAGRWWPSLVILIGFIVVVTAAVAAFLVKAGKFDPVSAYFSAAPGGFATMLVLGGELGGDERRISLVHAVRILLTVLIIAFWFRFFEGYRPGSVAALGSIADIAGRDFLILAVCAIGYPIAKRLKIPAAPLIGPMVLSAAVHMAGMTAAKPPSELVNLAQIVIGTNVGCRFVGVPVRHVFKTMYLSIAVTLFMVALAVVFAYLLNRLTGFGFEALWLAFSPGGLAEMTLISLAMGIDTAFVSTHHLLRMLFMVTAAPLVFAWLKKRLHLKKPHPPKESHEGVANPEP
ncbi:MAG TPA: AbrB family transcriptional regulator [Rhodospirillales bacterium]